MAIVQFPYSRIQLPASSSHPQGRQLRRPTVVASITAQNGKRVRYFMWLDTGADACLFPTALATMLGIDYLKLPSTLTAGVGSASNITYYANVNVDLGQGVSADVYAGFTEGMNAHGMGLLGQSGFFEKFDVHFSHKSGLFTVSISDSGSAE